MSEGRQLALLLVGAMLLAVVGIVVATAFPEPCEEVEGIGSLSLGFVDADDALPVDEAGAEVVRSVGDELGIGLWGGAVVLPPGTDVLPSDFGFFAVTDTDLVALRPGSSRASAPRDVSGSDVVPVGSTSAGIVTADGTIAVISSDYERERCGELPVDPDVLAVDRGFALLATDGGVRLWALAGEQRWDVDVDGIAAAALDDRVVHVVTPTGVRTNLLTDPAPVAELDLEEPVVLATTGGRLLLVERAAPDVLVDVTADVPPVGTDGGETELVVTRTDGPGPLVDAAATPAGLVLTTGDVLATDRGGAVAMPPGVEVIELVVSEDGQVGVLVRADGVVGPVLLVWGRDLAAVSADD